MRLSSPKQRWSELVRCKCWSGSLYNISITSDFLSRTSLSLRALSFTLSSLYGFFFKYHIPLMRIWKGLPRLDFYFGGKEEEWPGGEANLICYWWFSGEFFAEVVELARLGKL
jgi:hypothetical protein